MLKGHDNIALDGKTAKGSRKQDASVSHFLSAVCHELGLTLAQSGVNSKTNEIGVVHEVLKNPRVRGETNSNHGCAPHPEESSQGHPGCWW